MISRTTIRCIAEITSVITENTIIGILIKNEIIRKEEEYGEILDRYKSPTSASKVAKIEAILIYLANDARIFAVLTNLIRETIRTVEPKPDLEELNRLLLRDGLTFDEKRGIVIPSTGNLTLEKGLASELDIMLNGLDEQFVKMHEGSWSALASGGHDNLRQSITSARELLRQVIDHLAPQEPEMTRKQKVKSILGSESRAELVNSIGEIVDKIYAVQSASEHTEPNYETVVFTLKIVEDTLYYVLKILHK